MSYDQDYIDRETVASLDVYGCIKTDILAAAEDRGLKVNGMTECIWSLLLMDMFEAGWPLEDVIEAVCRYYRNVVEDTGPPDDDDDGDDED